MNRVQWIAIGVLAVVFAFGVGFGWQYARAHRLEEDNGVLRRELAFARLEAELAAAAVLAQRGSHELARGVASQFFTGLQQQIGEAPVDVRPEYEAILSQRDPTITMLSRAEPQAADVMALLAQRFRTARVGPNRALPMTPAADTAA